MKPLSLTLSAFGPYREEETLDFSAAWESGIFLIVDIYGMGSSSKWINYSAVCSNDTVTAAKMSGNNPISTSIS